VSGGRLTQDSVEDLAAIFESRKGVENFHKIAILEAAPVDGNIDDIASQAKIDFKPLPQQDDILFGGYIDKSEKRIRSKFRIPSLYLGLGEEFSRSTSQNIKLIAEEQTFRPERNDEDELINFTLMYDLDATKWKFRTVGPKLIEGAEAIDAIGKFARAGSLSINQSIKIMNRVLDLDAPLYNEEWADYPATMVLELSKRGWLKDSDKFAEVKETITGIVDETEKHEELKYELFEKLDEMK
jgi:capsid portal protein